MVFDQLQVQILPFISQLEKNILTYDSLHVPSKSIKHFLIKIWKAIEYLAESLLQMELLLI